MRQKALCFFLSLPLIPRCCQIPSDGDLYSLLTMFLPIPHSCERKNLINAYMYLYVHILLQSLSLIITF